jgi:hypothetical protein
VGIVIGSDGSVYSCGKFSDTTDFDPGTGVFNLTAVKFYDLYVQKLDNDGNFVWARAMGSSDFDDAFGIALDNNNNVLTVGAFSDTMDVNPLAGEELLISPNSRDGFTQKLDADGNFLWANHITGTGQNQTYSVTTDAAGNVYTTGHFQNTADFDNGSGTTLTTGFNRLNSFIQKIDPNGNLLWVKDIGSDNGTSSGKLIKIDDSGNIYSAGFFFDTIDYDPGPGVAMLMSLGDNNGWDIYIQKLDANGNFVWAKSFGGVERESVEGLDLDSEGNIYLTGEFLETANFNTGTGINNLISQGDRDAYVLKLDNDGNFVWVKQIGGTERDTGTEIKVSSNDNVYALGNFSDVVDFDPGTCIENATSNGDYDNYILQLDSDGNFVSNITNGGTERDFIYGIATDDMENAYVTGSYRQTVDFDPEANVNEFTAISASDAFVLKLKYNDEETSISSLGPNESFSIYPNPNNGQFQIDFNDSEIKSFELFNIQGKIIKKVSVSDIKPIDLNLKPGIYFLQIKTDKKSVVKKLVVE